jgi:hypothetical protein
MNNQTVTQILLDIKKGVTVPRKTKQMVIGYLTSSVERHKGKGDYVKAGEVQKVIDLLKK